MKLNADFTIYLLRSTNLGRDKCQVIDGVDVAGEDGIFVFLRSSAIKESMGFTKLAMSSTILQGDAPCSQR